MRTVLYVSCADDKLIVSFEMNPVTGALNETARTPVPGTDVPSQSSLPLALSADGRFLYAALRTAPFPVSSFAIEPGGLRHLGTARLPDSMCYLSTDQAGTRLFSASYGGACLGVSPIVDGVVADFSQVIPTPPKAHCARPAPDGRFVYAACLGGDVILAQRFDGAALEATAKPVARTQPGAGPRHLAFAENGRRLYGLNELDGTVSAYDRDPDSAALHEIGSVTALPQPVSGNAAAADIHLTPDGRFLYASVRSTNTLAAFRVDAQTGRLTAICHVPSEPGPRGFAIDPLGKFLLCAGLQSGMVATYAIDQQTGTLNRLGATRAGAGANWIEVLQRP